MFKDIMKDYLIPYGVIKVLLHSQYECANRNNNNNNKKKRVRESKKKCEV